MLLVLYGKEPFLYQVLEYDKVVDSPEPDVFAELREAFADLLCVVVVVKVVKPVFAVAVKVLGSLSAQLLSLCISSVLEHFLRGVEPFVEAVTARGNNAVLECSNAERNKQKNYREIYSFHTIPSL